jgi:hypothetical protein
MIPPLYLISSIDEYVRSDLQGLRDWYFSCLRYSTIGVALGVVLEEAESYPFRKQSLNRYGAMVVRHRLVSWVRKIEKIGWGLIIFGVIGEGVFESLVSRTDGLIQTFNDISLADTQRQTSEANVRVASAELAAESTKVIAMGYKAQIEDANARVKTAEAASKEAVAKVSTADARIAEAQQDAAAANRTAEHERLLRMQLESVVVARDLNGQQLNRLVASWRPFAGRTVVIRSLMNDADGTRLALLIRGALQTAGVRVDDAGIGRLMAIGMPMIGVSVDGPVAQEDLVIALRNGLLGEHILQPPPGPPAAPGETVGVTVGLKPLVAPGAPEPPGR